MAGLIRVDAVTDLKPMDDVIRLAQRYPHYVLRAARTVANEQPTLQQEQQVYPPVPVGSKYKRTGKLRAGYQPTRVFMAGTEILIETRYTGERKRHLYVKGRRQTQKHRITGWRKDDEINRAWMIGFRRRLIPELQTVTRALTNIR